MTYTFLCCCVTRAQSPVAGLSTALIGVTTPCPGVTTPCPANPFVSPNQQLVIIWVTAVEQAPHGVASLPDRNGLGMRLPHGGLKETNLKRSAV